MSSQKKASSGPRRHARRKKVASHVGITISAAILFIALSRMAPIAIWVICAVALVALLAFLYAAGSDGER